MPFMTWTGALRLAIDINVLVADILSAGKGLRNTAASALVEAVRTGTCPAGPIQLVTSLPIIENYANVLVRRLGYDAADADEKAWILQQYALAGPMPGYPYLSVGSGYIPFETEEGLRQSIANHLGRPEADKLFHEIQDDRYVLETALAGRADILATADLAGFTKGPAIQFERNDVLLFPFAEHTLVIATPRFVVYWLSQGIAPNAQFIADNPKDFARRS
ncbi:MAG: PIN domain-containing protein [Bradyrhizobiaceae bacterium]|nr:PIN domain-containing protein [Bradyrhizobiaceae bacterium]